MKFYTKSKILPNILKKISNFIIKIYQKEWNFYLLLIKNFNKNIEFFINNIDFFIKIAWILYQTQK